MKHILFIEKNLSEEEFNQIEDALDNTRLTYTLSRVTNSVSIHGSNDAVYNAKTVIEQLGHKLV